MRFCLIISVIIWIQIDCDDDKKNYRYDLRLAPQLFEEFQKNYNKTYTEKEKRDRFKIFKTNMKIVNALNQNVRHKWIAVLGPYTDLTYSEFVDKYNLTRYEPNGGREDRKILDCTHEKVYLFLRFSEYTKSLYDKWGSWQQPVEYYESNEGLDDYHSDYKHNDYY